MSNGGANQQWDFRSTGSGWVQLINRNSGRCLDVASGSIADGADIIQYTCGTGGNQRWQWLPTGGYYQLKARHSGGCLTLAADAVDLEQATCATGATTRQWSRA
ncbi:Nigrin b [Actinoplanes sp. SE50]|uniref:RICIN domain-containing protein n=1 Tax=unclassified Actinoplanes TaxID=2626549 RepID=UPI00023EC234|nr:MULTISPECIES: RICIN domain-containing protein [unclassified Actinoplanes]AEV83003.1 Nigrin b [Actinoplanes sp. SE50/110]ATO81399.1 Nigrin b [Actinoplanes sp. SE50]SLL98806.1 Nigrin b [Actinoplanes sp. SE50/110]